MGDENILRYNHNHVYGFGIKQILKGGFSKIGKFNFEPLSFRSEVSVKLAMSF